MGLAPSAAAVLLGSSLLGASAYPFAYNSYFHNYYYQATYQSDYYDIGGDEPMCDASSSSSCSASSVPRPEQLQTLQHGAPRRLPEAAADGSEPSAEGSGSSRYGWGGRSATPEQKTSPQKTPRRRRRSKNKEKDKQPHEMLATGDVHGALEKLQRLQRDRPGDPSVMVNLASALAQSGRFEEAEDLALQTVDVSPSHPLARMILGQVWLHGKRTGRKEEAFSQMRKAINLDRQAAAPDMNVPHIFGLELLRERRYEEAATQLQASVDRGSKTPEGAAAGPMGELGRALTKLERLEEALPWLQKSVAKQAERRSLSQLITVLLWLGEEDEARRVAKDAVKNGHFKHPLQRPSSQFFPDLLAKPMWEPSDNPGLEGASRYLKQDSLAGELLEELNAVKAKHPGGWRHQPERMWKPDAPGSWKEWKIFDGGDVPCRSDWFPKACKAIEDLSKFVVPQWAMFSVLTPGGHIRPHTGPSNVALTFHLCIADGRAGADEPGVKFRFGTLEMTQEYHNGSLFIVDDSFEHEVLNEGAHDRVVFFVQFLHPAVRAS
eukprot:TRINITY_DN16810_c0_g1_i3.p1 TRINITY_DN16810_c0_g1~~TRINITY_DN16810_c0_g1_i3.p1  ORF type:complete len:549 (+),score=136.73 TRINITY_DN16810_c0_g1_i3:57-1703(+)